MLTASVRSHSSGPLLAFCGRARDAGIVDEYVEPAQRVNHLFEHAATSTAVGDVADAL